MAEQRYKVYERLGAGGVGAVFRAYDSQLKRWVAIKRLLSAAETESADPEATELRREADTLASLRNPNIVTIFDVSSDPEGLFIVMELLQGEDLADVLARGPLSFDDFKELATQTLEGLLAAHQNHILHRDIKPENIKIERLPGGRLQSKIIDFGLARAGLRGRKQTEDQAGTVMGSIYYMAPEQLTREPVDARTDLYSLGCVFYEALSGRKAFDGESMNDVIDAHLEHKITPLHVIAPWVPPWLSAWVLRLMSVKPEDRPADSQQAIDEFRAWEKMPAVPIGPWMPMAYYPAYGAPAPYPQPAYGPAQDMAAYPVPNDMNGAVPVQVAPVEEPVLYAQPVADEAETAPVAPRRGSTPVPPRAGPRAPSKPVSPITGQATIPSTGAPAGRGGVGKFIIVGGALVVVAIVAYVVVNRGKGTADSGGSGGTILVSGPPKVTFELPQDRMFPLLSQTICMHFVGNVGVLAHRTEGGKQAAANLNEPVLEWHDLSSFGNDNYLRAFNASPDYSPLKVNWPSQPSTAGAKPNRPCLDFRLRNGTPCAMNLTDPEATIESLPFGSNTQVEKFTFTKGATLSVVFQAHAPDLPTRVCTLISDDGATLSLRVDKDRNLVAEAGAGGSLVEIQSSGVNATVPCIANVSWGALSGELSLRARDATGKTFRGEPKKVAAPAKPMRKLQLGRVLGAGNQPVAKGDSFSGFIGELIVFSTALKPDQMDANEGQLKSYYIQDAPKAPPKPAPAPAKK